MLQKIDQNVNFYQPSKATVWNMVHFSLDLVCSNNSAFIVENVIEVLQYDFWSVDDLLPNSEVGTLAPYCVYVVFFTLVHAYLFLYPCFRAAAIATARAKLISAISKKQWDNIPLSVQTSFVQYSHIEELCI